MKIYIVLSTLTVFTPFAPRRSRRQGYKLMDFFLLTCDESSDASDIALLFFFKNFLKALTMILTEEILDLQSLKDQRRETD